ncbi:MAG: PIN domain-containing protein [Vicinamibacterales bacterium]
MIVVDTSVWIAALRSRLGAEAATLRPLLDADEVALALPVRIELCAGARHQDRRSLRSALSGLPVLRPTGDTWTLIESWAPRAADAGERFALGDLMIGALASEIQGLVWSLDADFRRLAKLGLVNLYH